MKKFIPVVIIIILIVVGIVLGIKKQPVVQEAPASVPVATIANGTYCYNYDQKATPDAPYSVNETITMKVTDGVINGIKQGTQSGPDMTNGYTGTVTGEINDKIITAVFDYTIEGSNNQEQEEYEITPTSLIKHRYPLKESGNMLVPDKTGTVKNIEYKMIECL